MNTIKIFLRWILTTLYKIEIHGIEHFHQAGNRVLIVANHTSYLDAVLLALFLPDKLTYAINTRIAKAWWVRPALTLVNFFPMDPANPLSTKSLIKYLKEDHKAVIFPEGRITVTGSLMKIYQGPGMVADKSGAQLLPVRIEGAQYTPFSRMRGLVRIRWFPQITLRLLAPRRISLPDELRGRARRNLAGKALTGIMTEMMFATSNYHRTLFEALLDARNIHGGEHIIAEDIERIPLSYDKLITRIFVLGAQLNRNAQPGEYAGVLLPNTLSTVIVFFALQLYGRVPAMLNFTVGANGVVSACKTACIRTVYTSRRFVEVMKLSGMIEQLREHAEVVFLEDVRESVGMIDKLRGLIASRFARMKYRRMARGRSCDDPAVVLYTSGTEGAPKGVVLSHANMLANREQLASRVDFGAQDVILNVLPMFHSFGLTAGTLLPLISGIRVFFYPSPLHYRIVPEVAYEINATILFGTNTFLAGYGRFAHPYDFYSVRYVFAGAEKLQEDTRRLWVEKFGIRIFEGYGATETSPALTINTPINYRTGTVGCLLPGIDYRLEPVPGIAEGGRLWVRGPNIMMGYLLADNPGVLKPLTGEQGDGWYDTGDIVTVDDDGYITISGRLKRFAKIGGEMVSLTAAENLATRAWPDKLHAVVSLPDPQKGEQLVLITEYKEANRSALLEYAKKEGIGEINVPRKIIITKTIPLLGSGKVDYHATRELAAQQIFT